MSRFYNGYPEYVPVAKRRANALKEVAKLRKKGQVIEPVEIQGRLIARSFWGKGWCEHLEGFGDLSNRLPRGRTYARNGSVCHLGIKKGEVEAIVSGSQLYHVSVQISPLTKKKWEALKKLSTGQISSLIALLQGRLSDDLMSVVADRKKGLFPLRQEISYQCDCPDGAVMCKHIAAVMYGTGARLDTQPELLFLLRGVNQEELISADTSADSLVGKGSKRSRRRSLAGDQLGNVFGIELEEPTPGAEPETTRKKTGKKESEKKATPAVKKASTAQQSVKKAANKRAKKVVKKSTQKAPRRKPFKATGPAVVALRKTLGLTKAEFAERADVSFTAVTKWESAAGPLNLREKNLTRLKELARLAH